MNETVVIASLLLVFLFGLLSAFGLVLLYLVFSGENACVAAFITFLL